MGLYSRFLGEISFMHSSAQAAFFRAVPPLPPIRFFQDSISLPQQFVDTLDSPVWREAQVSCLRTEHSDPGQDWGLHEPLNLESNTLISH